MTQSKKLINTFRSIKEAYDAKTAELVKPLCDFGDFCNKNDIGDDYFNFPYEIITNLEDLNDEIMVVYSSDGSEYDEYVPTPLFNSWLEDRHGFLGKYEEFIKSNKAEDLKNRMNELQEKLNSYKEQLKYLGYDPD